MPMNKRPLVLTTEDRNKLAAFFTLLIAIDRRHKVTKTSRSAGRKKKGPVQDKKSCIYLINEIVQLSFIFTHFTLCYTKYTKTS